MKYLLAIIILKIFSTYQISAQTSKDVLENGIFIEKGKTIILKFDEATKTLEYDHAKSFGDPTNPVNFIPLDDSLIFLASKNALNIYIRPLNPLNYSFESEVKQIIDPINAQLESAIDVVIDVLKTTARTPITTSKGVTSTGVPVNDTCDNFLKIENGLKQIQGRLKNSWKDSIVQVFQKLKLISFSDEPETERQIKEIDPKKNNIEYSFRQMKLQIDSIKTLIANYNCEKPNGFIVKYIFTLIMKDFSLAYEEQMKRLRALQSAYNLVSEMKTKASIGAGVPGLRWCIKAEMLPIVSGKISMQSVTIKESGYKLSNDNEIIQTEMKDVTRRTLRFRKFQRFVPEVAVGIAYTFLDYNTYGTISNDQGEQFISEPIRKRMTNFNVTTMINFNYFIEHSTFNPFWQVGVGVNPEVQTILTGIGGRGILGSKRFTVSGGIALTFIKELDNLNVGDKVSGTAEIEKDLKYQFTWPPKPYVAIQYSL